MSSRRPYRPPDAPVLLVAGVDATAIATTALSLQLGLERAVAVNHRIDLSRSVLVRTVSDLGGVLEVSEVPLEHACVECAVREDVVPTLRRLAHDGRWRHVVSSLPVAAPATQVTRGLRREEHGSASVRVAGLVTALDGHRVCDDLLGDDLVADRAIATADDDRRGVAEVAAAMVESADVVCLSAAPSEQERSLVLALARPDAAVVSDASDLDAEAVAARTRSERAARAWTDPVRRGDLPPLGGRGAWRLDLGSPRPVDPDRFLAEVGSLGEGPRRSRGCFWLTSRPDQVCAWEAAGGLAAVGTVRRWEPGERPLTRLVVVGIDDGTDERARIAAAFDRCLSSSASPRHGRAGADGLEEWLGPILGAA